MRRVLGVVGVLAFVATLALWLWPRSPPVRSTQKSVTVCKPYTNDNGAKVVLHNRAFADRAVIPETATDALGSPSQNKKSYSLGCNGEGVWEFTDNLIVDVEGDDLFIFERGNDEPVKVSVSKDGVNWIEVGVVRGGKASIDIAGKGTNFRYVLLADETDKDDPANEQSCKTSYAGADIDAIATYGHSWMQRFDSRVFFATDEFELTQDGKAELNRYFDAIKGAEDREFERLEVIGHTDTVGDLQSNQRLSEDRARAVTDYLTSTDRVAPGKVVHFGKGETELAVPTPNPMSEPANRRVELIFIPASPCPQDSAAKGQ